MTHYTLTGSLIQVLKGYRVPASPRDLMDYIVNADIPDDADDALMAAYGMLMVAQYRAAHVVDTDTLRALADDAARRIRAEGRIRGGMVDDLTDLFVFARTRGIRMRARVYREALALVGMRLN